MIRLVLFDRDGTLIVDRSDPIELMPGVVEAVSRLRERDIRIGVVTNQPHAGTDAAAFRKMQWTHDEIETRIGRVDAWFICTHLPELECACRKPEPRLIVQGVRAFGVAPGECVVIGDIGSDIEAAQRAGVHAILVPTAATLADEVRQAPVVRRSLLEAVEYALGLVPA